MCQSEKRLALSLHIYHQFVEVISIKSPNPRDLRGLGLKGGEVNEVAAGYAAQLFYHNPMRAGGYK